MTQIYNINDYQSNPQPNTTSPLTRNQEILAAIQAIWAARSPEQIRMAEIRGTEEELEAVERRLARLLECPSAVPPSPSEIVDRHGQDSRNLDQGRDDGREH